MPTTPPRPIIHAVAERVITEIIPCTLQNGCTGFLELIRHGNLVTTNSNINKRGTFTAKRNVQIATIPQGYRPRQDIGGVSISAFAAGYITVKATGEVIFLPSVNAGASIYFSLLTWTI